jgi:iron complex transport system permease protein
MSFALTLSGLVSSKQIALVRTLERRNILVLCSLSVFLIAVMILSVGIGAVAITPGQVIAILGAKTGLSLPWTFTDQQALVLTGIRLPRVLMGALVGAGLSVAGALMQGLFRNALADPGLIGVSSGAAFGAASMIVFSGLMPGFIATSLGAFGVAFAAFWGGLAVTLIVYRIATRHVHTSVATMLLAGIAMNALCGAGTGALVLLTDDAQLRDITFWTLGNMGGATWGTLGIVAPFVSVSLLAAPRMARALNAMLLGEADARHLGIRTERVKRQVIGLTALTVGATTAITGLIGFVGLVVPHLVRLVLGPDHRTLLPASALLGATLLIAADLLARTLIQPAEIPIGILTALGGAPFFLMLLLRDQGRNGYSI